MNGTNDGLGRCPECGKQMYSSRRYARQAARRLLAFGRMSAYECSSGYWHVGHLDVAVVRGRVSRDERYGGSQ